MSWPSRRLTEALAAGTAPGSRRQRLRSKGIAGRALRTSTWQDGYRREFDRAEQNLRRMLASGVYDDLYDRVLMPANVPHAIHATEGSRMLLLMLREHVGA